MPDFDNQVKKEIGGFLYSLRLYGHLHQVELDDNIKAYYHKFSDFTEYFCSDFSNSNKQDFYNDQFTNIISLINGLKYDFEEIIKMNVEKLSKRLEKGTIIGSGDDR
jgi:hypothetical protein